MKKYLAAIAVLAIACGDKATTSPLAPGDASDHKYHHPPTCPDINNPACGVLVVTPVGTDDGSWNFNLQGADAVAFFTKLKPSLNARSQATVQRFIDEINSVIAGTGPGYGVFVVSSRNAILVTPGGKYISLTNKFEVNVTPCQICGVALK